MSTRSIRTALRALAPGNPGERGDHPGLVLDRYLAEIETGGGNKSALEALYQQVTDIPTPPLYRLAYARWHQALAELPGAAGAAFTVQGRLIVGLGAESVRETSIGLHRAWGVPIIPGSSLKGLARRYLERQLPDEHPTKGVLRAALFGSTESAGYVTFLDAWYVPRSAPGDRPLARDTVTVHHPRYYNQPQGRRRAPWDFDDPTPIPFLSARGSFLVAVRGPDAGWATAALDLLREALADWGIGAKTSSGYGRLHETGSRFFGPAPTCSAGGAGEPGPRPAATDIAADPGDTPRGPLDRDTARPPATSAVPAAEASPATPPATPPQSPSAPAPSSLAERVAAVPDDPYRLNEQLAALAREAERLPAGPERDAACWAIVQRLRSAGTWDLRRTQKRPWVQAIIRYLNARRGR